MERAAHILLRFDALDLDINLSACANGTVEARVPELEIRSSHTLGSLAGFGESADEAICQLWQAIEDISSDECIRLQRGASLRYFHWNGAAWKEIPAVHLGYPATMLEHDDAQVAP
jgi:hypothetical protein